MTEKKHTIPAEFTKSDYYNKWFDQLWEDHPQYPIYLNPHGVFCTFKHLENEEEVTLESFDSLRDVRTFIEKQTTFKKRVSKRKISLNAICFSTLQKVKIHGINRTSGYALSKPKLDRPYNLLPQHPYINQLVERLVFHRDKVAELTTALREFSFRGRRAGSSDSCVEHYEGHLKNLEQAYKFSEERAQDAQNPSRAEATPSSEDAAGSTPGDAASVDSPEAAG